MYTAGAVHKKSVPDSQSTLITSVYSYNYARMMTLGPSGNPKSDMGAMTALYSAAVFPSAPGDSIGISGEWAPPLAALACWMNRYTCMGKEYL